MESKTKVVIYARVSTLSQDHTRQIDELRNYAQKMNYEIVNEFSEKISGAKTIAERQALTDLLDYISTNKVDKILIYECSRLSRRAVDFLTMIETLNKLKVSLYIHTNGLETLLPNKEINPIASLVLGILAQFNSMERTLIRSRMQSGYIHYRNSGGKVGRKVGYIKTDEMMQKQYVKELALLRKNISLLNIYHITGTSINTLQKLKKYL